MVGYFLLFMMTGRGAGDYITFACCFGLVDEYSPVCEMNFVSAPVVDAPIYLTVSGVF
jgi:hypothetical protein